MKKWWIALAALALILTLLPVSLSRADGVLRPGDTCPYCNKGALRLASNGIEQHGYKCNNSECEYYTKVLWIDHSFGETKCGQVKCLGCEKYCNISHDWVPNTNINGNGWYWYGSMATLYLKCQRAGCGDTDFISDYSPVPGAKTYDENTGKVSCTYTATVTKDEKTFTGTKTVVTAPIERRTDLWVVGDETYTSKPQSVPQSYDCHYQMDWWTGPVLTGDSGVYEENGEFYRDVTYTDTMVYKLAGYYIQKVEATPATCTEKGVAEHYQCWMCQRRYSEKTAENMVTLEDLQTNALGHDLKETGEVPATCTDPGTEAYWTCQRDGCGKMFSDKDGEHEITAPVAIEPLGHDWAVDTELYDNGWDWQFNGDGSFSSARVFLKCNREGCGGPTYLVARNASPVSKSYDAETGKVTTVYETFVTVDEQDFSSTAEVLSDPIERATTYYIVGDETYTSEPASVPETINCHYQPEYGWEGPVESDVHVEQEGGEWVRYVTRTYTKAISAKGFYIQKVPATPATCTEKGVTEHYQCWMCKKRYTEKAAINEVTLEEMKTDALGHDLTETKKVEPTCTEPGTEAYWACQRDGCGKMFSDEKGENEITAPVTIKALGHDLKKTDRVEPICTEPGTEAYWTCQRDGCGKMFSDKDGKNGITEPVTIKALGHDLKKTDRVEPTCTTLGTEAYWTCQRENCSKLFSDEKGENEIDEPVTIQALGHDLIHHDAQAPTCTAIGWDAYDTCSRCDYTTYAEKAALGHDLVHHAAQAPTCTAIGWDAYDTCSRCDYTTYVEKAALGHDLVHHDAKAPTCTEVGWDAYDTCSRCNYSTYVEKSALGHDYQITSRTITIITSRCSHCGDSEWWYNPNSRYLVDGLVRDGEGASVDYSAGVSRVDGKRVLTVTPDPVDGKVSLYLTPEEVALWLRQGIDTVTFSTDFVALEIDLSEITAEWFPLEDGAEIDFFVFTLAPAENSAEVRVEALIGEEKTPAEVFTGIALFLENQEINVTENGVYRKD